MIHGLHDLNLILRIVRQHDLERTQNPHAARSRIAQGLAHTIFERAHLDQFVFLGHTSADNELAQRRRRVTAATHARDRRHPGIIPARHYAFLNQCIQFALTGYRVGDVQAGKFDLARPMLRLQLVEKPVVERSMILEFERAQRVRNALVGIGQAMRKIVHRVDAPFVAGVLVRYVANPVDRRIPQVHVRRCHIDFRPQQVLPIGEFARVHACKQVEVFLDAAVTVWAVFAWLGQRATVLANLLRAQAVDVGHALLDELDGRLVEAVEIIGRMRQPVPPVKSEPSHVFLNGLDVFRSLLPRIRVIEP